MTGEFFFMVAVAGIVATHCTLMMALWAPMLKLPRADFPLAMADLSFGASFAGKPPSYWSGLFVIYLNGLFFAFLYSTVAAPWLEDMLIGTDWNMPLMWGALYGVILFVVSGVFFQPVFLKLGPFLVKAHPLGWLTSLIVHGIFGLVCGWLAPVV
jgi:hypothetical protein